MVTEKIFETALGISSPWFIAGMNFEAQQRKLSIRVDFEVGSRFAVPGQTGEHPVHDTVSKTYRHLNFFQHECELTVRVPRVKLPDGKVVQITAPWAGKLCGFTLLFEAFAANLRAHHGKPTQIDSVSIDMSPAFISGVTEHLPHAQITFDKFHVIAHASEAIDQMRRLEQKRDPSLKGLRWALLKDRSKLNLAQRTELDGLLARMTTTRTARAWHYREQLRDILTRKQPNVVHRLLNRWCSNVLRSKVEPMKAVALMVRSHLEGILAWVTSRQTNGFLEAINGLFQAAKRKARGYGRFRTIRMIIFLIAGKLDFSQINPYAAA